MLTNINQSNKHRTIKLSIRYLDTNETLDIEIERSKRVIDLKKEIEKLLGIKILNSLMVKRTRRPTSTSLNDENATLEECRLRNDDIIIIAKTDVLGGGCEKEFLKSSEIINMEINQRYLK